MAPGLQRLKARIEGGEAGVLDAAFRADWAAFEASVLRPPAS
jgi:hypothetical protein